MGEWERTRGDEKPGGVGLGKRLRLRSGTLGIMVAQVGTIVSGRIQGGSTCAPLHPEKKWGGEREGDPLCRELSTRGSAGGEEDIRGQQESGRKNLLGKGQWGQPASVTPR